MTRTQERENLFKWAGPIGENRIILWAKKSSNIQPFDDINKVKRRIGVVRNAVGEQLTLVAGFPENRLYSSVKPELAARMLAHNTYPLWAYSEVSESKLLEGIGGNLDDYEAVHVLKKTIIFCL